MTTRAFAAILLVVSLQACGLQLAIGRQARSRKTEVPFAPQTVAVGARALPLRTNGPYVGGDLVASDWLFDGEVALQMVQVTGGYRIQLDPGALELGLDLGAGAPLTDSERNTAVYLGATTTGVMRISGAHDRRDGFAVGGLLWDGIVIGRVGLWGRPLGDDRDELVDASLQLGVRVTAITDVVVSSGHDWEAP